MKTLITNSEGQFASLTQITMYRKTLILTYTYRHLKTDSIWWHSKSAIWIQILKIVYSLITTPVQTLKKVGNVTVFLLTNHGAKCAQNKYVALPVGILGNEIAVVCHG